MSGIVIELFLDVGSDLKNKFVAIHRSQPGRRRHLYVHRTCAIVRTRLSIVSSFLI